MNKLEEVEAAVEVLHARVLTLQLVLSTLLSAAPSGVIWLTLQRLRELHEKVFPEPLSDAVLQEIQTVADELGPLMAAAEQREGIRRPR